MATYATFTFPTTGLTTLKGNFVTPSEAQVVKASDGSLLTNNSTNRALASIVGSDIAVAGTYRFTIPAATPSGNYKLLIYFNPAWTDGEAELAETGVMFWNGTTLVDAPTGSSSVGTDTTTLGELRDILQRFARFAGISADFSSGKPYGYSDADYTIQGVLNTLIGKTKCTARTDSISLLAAATTIDFSSLTGFNPKRILRMWAIPADGSQMSKNPDIDVIDLDRVDAWITRNGTQTGHPGAIGFSLQDGTNRIARTADIAYTVKVRHWPTLSTWTVGDSGAGSTVINMSGEIAREAIEMAGVMRLQGSQIEALPVTDRRRAQWDDLVNRAYIDASLGAHSTRRLSLDEARWQRQCQDW